jgi:LTXXQ motif family protein
MMKQSGEVHPSGGTPMRKIVFSGFTALIVTAASAAYAQTSSTQAPTGQAPSGQTPAAADLPSAEGVKALTDLRVEVVKAALQLRPEQNQMWSAVESAIRERSAARHARIVRIATQRNNTGDRNIIELMRARSDSLSQRAEALKKLADAWQPLYATLDDRQKLRLTVLGNALRQVMHAMDDEEENDE